MKVLLINPNVDLKKTMGVFSKILTPIAPLGIAYLSALLKKNGIHVLIYDQFEKKTNEFDIEKLINEQKFDIIGFSVLTPNMPSVEKTAKLIRKKHPEIKIILGNTHATVFKKELVESGVCDFVVYGEGEVSFLQLVLMLEKEEKNFEIIKGLVWMKNGIPFVNPPQDQIENLNSLPFPDWDDLNLKRYIAPPTLIKREVILPVQFSRGCTFNCSFCAQNIAFPKLMKRSIENLLDEIERNIEKYQVTWFGFQDSIFPLTKNDAFDFAEGMIKRGLHKKCKWITEARVNTLCYDSLKALKEAGLYLIMIGFESGNKRILNEYKKGISIEKAYSAIKWMKKLNIVTFGLFMLGLPGEDEQTMEDTIRFAISLDPEIAKFNKFVPYPGSQLFEKYMNSEIVKNMDMTSFCSWNFKTAPPITSYINNISHERMVEIQRNAVLRFYLRPKKIFHLMKLNVFQPSNIFTNIEMGLKLIKEFFLSNEK